MRLILCVVPEVKIISLVLLALKCSLNFFLELLSNQMGEKMLRIKGIINVEGEDRPAIIHGVQHIFHPLEWLDKWPDNDVSTRLVFITNKIEKSIVEQFFKIIE